MRTPGFSEKEAGRYLANVSAVKQLLSLRRVFIGAALLITVAACGGGGGGTPPAMSSTTTPVPTASATGPGTLALTIGGSAPTVNGRKRPSFIPPSMTTAFVEAQPVSPSASPSASPASTNEPCTPAAGCQFSIQLSPGSYDVSIGASNSNAILAQVTVPVTIASGQTSTMHSTLNGIISEIGLALKTPLLLNGAAQTTQLLVTPYDSAGDVIIAPGDFTEPITFTETSTNATAGNGLALSGTQLNGPNDTITVSYDGKTYNSLVLTPNYTQLNLDYGSQFVIAPQLVTTEYAIPSGAPTTNSIITGPDGNVWAASYDSIVRVTTSGQLSEYCTNPGSSQIVSGPNGQIWFGTDLNYQPSPFASYTCAATWTGLRELSTSGVQSALNDPGYTPNTTLSGPVLAPDGSAWVDQQNSGGTSTLENFNAGGEVQTLAPLLNGSPVEGLPFITADGSFWFLTSPSVVRCTSANNCASSANPISATFFPLSISAGPNNSVLLQDAADVYNLDESFNVLWHTNQPWHALLDGPAAYINNAVWIGGTENADTHPVIIHLLTDGTNFCYLQLPAAPVNGAQAATVGGILLGPDGRLWYTRGSVIGVAPIQ